MNIANDKIHRMINAAISAIPDRIHISAVMGPDRWQPIPKIRYAVWYSLRYDHKWTYARIGKIFNRDHQVIYYGIKRAKAFLDMEPEGEVADILKAIREAK
jgi:chromosomal replication initiation ATPase DnaA